MPSACTTPPATASRPAAPPILSRFAEVYPGYCVHYDYPFRPKIFFEGDRTFPWPVPDYRAAKWDWWAYMDIPEDLLQAYELVRPSGVLDEAAQRRIEADLFHASVAFVRSYPPALSNMDPTLLRGLITAGRVLGEPEYVHDAIRRIDLLARRQFFADGVWREGAVSYHNQTVRGLDILGGLLRGYTDPAEYVPPAGEDRLVEFDLDARLPILARAREVPGRLRLAGSSPSTTPGRGNPASPCRPRRRCCCRSDTRVWGEAPAATRCRRTCTSPAATAISTATCWP